MNKFFSIKLILFLVAVLSFDLFGQISPGDLTQAHAKLEGISNCTKCHVLGEKVFNSKCLECHSEIKDLINLNRGYHSSEEVQKKECRNCHSEHNGRNFRIINFQPKEFDHSKTKFELKGKHAQLNCEKCHQAKFISDNKIKKRKHTFLGLETSCNSCHEDMHEKTLGYNCKSCHGFDSFKPAVNFNHANAKFKLSGAHQKVDCIKCHVIKNKDGKNFQNFKDISFASCESCHKDIHNGKLGKECQSCHNTEAFKNINEGSFNHSKTNFSLAGRHKLVSCRNCHTQGISKKLNHDKCSDCHKDYHKGEFKIKKISRDCVECHNENGFHPSVFTIAKHNQTKFKLSGGHLAVPCESCHYKNEKWSFKNIGIDCIACHINIHKNEIDKKFMPNDDCNSCHQTDNWQSVEFDHDKTEFKLIGKHKNVECRNCHLDKKGSNNLTSKYKFVSMNSDCENCHKDIHYGQFKTDQKTDCGSCHGFDNWKPYKFDHDKTKFSISGAHQKLNCSACHKKITENGYTFTKFKLEDYKCAFCHS